MNVVDCAWLDYDNGTEPQGCRGYLESGGSAHLGPMAMHADGTSKWVRRVMAMCSMVYHVSFVALAEVLSPYSMVVPK
ncbi:hypothetical protein NDU88_003356 [Pleurodeles waltl]|uniref:Uncharacterized protein n=1 Tax=Pleurodeles waltl TaxID=8319 RepID=A0AAV7WNV4_PLEWA|nr:hypothetical protein NDU88_003356 [Pleurodeles waltl]